MQPEDVLPGDIDANLGAPWIPERDVQAFAADLFGVPPSAIHIGHLKKDAVWTVDADATAEHSVAATSEVGTPRANGVWLLEQALNLKTPVIYDTVQGADREERVVNQEATLAAREKQKQIKERFRAWVFADPDRTERLVRLYNDTYNNLRPRLFDGSHLEFPGMNRTITLDPHQKDAVWRGMSSGNTLLGHVVGGGKTFTMSATGMKMKQAGLRKKPMYVGAQPYAGAVRPRVPAALSQRPAAGRHQGGPDHGAPQVPHRQDRQRRLGRHHHRPTAASSGSGCPATTRRSSCASRSRNTSSSSATPRARRHARRGSRNIIKTIEKQKAKPEERLNDLLAEDEEGRRPGLRRAGRRSRLRGRGALLQEPGDADQDGPRGRHPDRRVRARLRPLHEGPLPGREAPGPRRNLRHRHADLQHHRSRCTRCSASSIWRGCGPAASSISTRGRPPSARWSIRWRSPPTARR